ncbi:MAG TPA: nuclear transport factor 2 family protein [Verrucomicrobiaceae bacterium]
MAAHPDDASIRAFLNRYFETWSKRDMDAYGALFDTQARIYYVGNTGGLSGGLVSEGTMDFLHGQKMAHEQSEAPMSERPLEMKIQGDRKVAQAAVTWVLSKGNKEDHGTDFFTLRRDGESWKIVSLVFYNEEE